MGYDITLGRPKSNQFGVTYNYCPILKRVLGEGGLRNLNGLSGEASIKLLDEAQAQLVGKPLSDYWAPTEGNVKAALQKLLVLAKKRKKSIWQVS